KEFLKKIEKYTFEEASAESRDTMQNIHDLVGKIKKIEKQIEEKKFLFSQRVIIDEIEDPVGLYESMLEKIYTYDSIVIPEKGVIFFTKLFYKVHKKKQEFTEDDLHNLRQAKIFAEAKYNPFKDYLKVRETIEDEINSFKTNFKAQNLDT